MCAVLFSELLIYVSVVSFLSNEKHCFITELCVPLELRKLDER